MGVAALDYPKDLNFLTLISSSTYLVETFPALKPLLGICSQITQHFVYNSLTNQYATRSKVLVIAMPENPI